MAADRHTQPLTAPGTEPLIAPPPREPRVPAWVRKAMMRGLSLRPEDRFPSMGALLEQLSGPPAVARSVWVSAGVLLLVAAGVLGYRGALQRQAALCGGAEARLERIWDPATEKEVATAFSVTGAPYAGTTFASVKSGLDDYAQGWTRMHTDTCRATRVRGEQTEAVLSLRMLCLDRRLKALESATELLRKSDVKVLDRAVDVVNALPRVEECADVEALSMPIPPPGDEKSRVAMALLATQVARAETLRSAGQYKRAAELATQAVEEARGLGHAPLLADALVQQGFAYLMDTDGPSAERALLEAWRVAEAGRHDEARVRAAWGLTYVQGELLGNLNQARGWADLGLAALPRVGKRPDLEIRLRESLGVLLYRQGRFQEGAEELERVLAFSDQTVGLEHPSRVALLNNLSLCYGELGQSAKMIQVLEASVALGERLHGSRHPSLVSVHNNLADSYLEVMDLDRAEAHIEQALGTLEATVGPEHPKVGFVLNTKASLLLYRKRYAESLALNQRALGLMERMTGARHQILAHPLGGMGEALVALGRPREALPYLERALGLDNPQPASRARADFHLARALMLLKLEDERARSLAVQARELYLGIGKKAEAAEVEAWLGAQPR